VVLTVGQAGTTAERRCRVLVADEENPIRQLLVRILERCSRRRSGCFGPAADEACAVVMDADADDAAI